MRPDKPRVTALHKVLISTVETGLFAANVRKRFKENEEDTKIREFFG